MNQPDTLCQEGLRAITPSAEDDTLSPEVGRLCRLLRQAPMFRSLGCDEIARFARGVREIKIFQAEGWTPTGPWTAQDMVKHADKIFFKDDAKVV